MKAVSRRIRVQYTREAALNVDNYGHYRRKKPAHDSKELISLHYFAMRFNINGMSHQVKRFKHAKNKPNHPNRPSAKRPTW